MAGKVNKSLMERLAVGAAEKRAYGFLYGNQGGGGRWGGGGYGGYGMGGMGNPYMGGGGYGGYGGGGYGGMPMMGQSFAGPGGRGSYYGMDPRFAGTFQQMLQQQMGQQGQAFGQQLGQQQQGFERGTLPGLDIGAQSQQTDVIGQRQNLPIFQHQVGQAQQGAAHAYTPQNLGSAEVDKLDAQRAAAEKNEGVYQTRLNDVTKRITDASAPFALEQAAHQKALDALKGASNYGGSLGWAQHRASKGDTAAKAILTRLGMDPAGEYSPISQGSNPFGGDKEYKAALEAAGQLDTLAARRQAALEPMLKERAGYQTYLDTYGQQQKDFATSAKARREAMQAEEQRAGEEAHKRRNEAFGQGAKTTSTLTDTANKEVTSPTKPGVLPAPGAVPPTPPTGTPGEVPRPPTVVHPPAAPVQQRPPNFQSTPGGPSGPRGPIKVASIVELAHNAARIHLEKRLFKQAGLGDLLGGQSALVPGDTTRTGRGMGIKSTQELMDKVRKSMLPQVAAAAMPTGPRPGDIQMPAGIPTSAAHLSPDMAAAMGISPEQHSMLRKALGLG